MADSPAGPHQGARYAVPWKGRLVVANTDANPTGVWFSKPGSITIWAPESFQGTNYDITGLAQQKNQVLIFHNGSVERLRGTEPPDNARTDVDGDLILDSLFDRAGCYDARSIAYWNENVLFSDARGVFLTDGAAVRNLCLQGTVMNRGRRWERPRGTSPSLVAAVIYRDYYMVTIRHVGYPPATFVIEIPSRRVFMLSNIDSTTFASWLGRRAKGSAGAGLDEADARPVLALRSRPERSCRSTRTVRPCCRCSRRAGTGWARRRRSSG